MLFELIFHVKIEKECSLWVLEREATMDEYKFMLKTGKNVEALFKTDSHYCCINLFFIIVFFPFSITALCRHVVIQHFSMLMCVRHLVPKLVTFRYREIISLASFNFDEIYLNWCPTSVILLRVIKIKKTSQYTLHMRKFYLESIYIYSLIFIFQ